MQLNLNQADINRGFTIEFGAKRNVKNDMSMVHLLSAMTEKLRNLKLSEAKLNKIRKERRMNTIKLRKRVKPQSKLIKALIKKENQTENALFSAKNRKENSVIMRNKRSVSRNLAGRREMQIENLQKFIESDDSIEDDTFSSASQQQKKELNHSDSKHDFAFDIADTDHIFNEDDNLLVRYFHQKRGADADSYGTFTDLMHFTANDNGNEHEFLRPVHYGDGFMNDDVEGNAESDNTGNEELYDSYDAYDDY